MRRSVKRAVSLGVVLALGLACLFSVSSCGSKPNSWIDLKPSGALPSARFGAALLYLSATGKVFMFGGAADETRPLSDTWMYDPHRNSWADLKPSGEAPPQRWAMGAAYDPAANKVVIFGGMGVAGGLLNDTWAYDVTKNAWSKLASSTSPSIRYRAAMAYDQATGRLMLFGGRYLRTTANGYFQQDYMDTWAFDLAQEAWTDLGPSGASPAPSSGSATLMSTGPDRSVLLLAGVPPLPPIPAYIPPDKMDKNWSTWRYEATKNTWTSGVPPALSPAASQYYTLTFDSTLGKAVLFGGQDHGTLNAGTLNDTWIYDPVANTWTLALAGGSDTPSPRIDHGMVYDPETNRVILFGGRSADGKTADLPSETWEYIP